MAARRAVNSVAGLVDTALYTTDRKGLAAALEQVAASRPRAVAVRCARDVSDHHEAGGVTHAGPPIAVDAMCPPMRAALGAALVLEGVAATSDDAINAVADGQIACIPNHDAGGVGPMAGVVTPSMPVLVAHDETTGRQAWVPLNEGSGRVLRYGADGPDVLERLQWMSDTLAPALHTALERAGGLDLVDIIARSLLQGDEAHHQTGHGTALSLAALGDALDDADPSVATFIAGNGQWFLNLAMVASKLALDCARDVPGSSLVTAIARNGVDVGIQLAGTGDRWYTGPAALPEPALLFDGYAAADMNPDLGDSAIVETYGLGALAVEASPTAATLCGLRPEDSPARMRALRTIAAGQAPECRLPDGSPAILGIDARAVVTHRLSPPVHTGIAHRQPGIGQIGAGVTHPPLAAFDAAIAALDAGATA